MPKVITIAALPQLHDKNSGIWQLAYTYNHTGTSTLPYITPHLFIYISYFLIAHLLLAALYPALQGGKQSCNDIDLQLLAATTR